MMDLLTNREFLISTFLFFKAGACGFAYMACSAVVDEWTLSRQRDWTLSRQHDWPDTEARAIAKLIKMLFSILLAILASLGWGSA